MGRDGPGRRGPRGGRVRVGRRLGAPRPPPPPRPRPRRAPATTAPATTRDGAREHAPAGPGNAAAGKQVFVAASCAGCHKGLGTKPGYGPKLAGKGLAEATIRTTVIEGGSLMPGGLVEGQDLADVVAYVSSLQ